MELVYTQEFEVTQPYADPFGRLKSAAMLTLAQQAAEGHCRQLQLDRQALEPKGLFWAVLRHRLQIDSLPVLGDRIVIKTWPMPTTRVAYPRAMAAYSEDGRRLFRCVSIWVLMDAKSRAMVLPGKSGVQVPGTLQGEEPELPASLNPKDLPCQTERTVRYSHLDQNGHMNNTCYLEFVEDLLPASFHSTHVPHEITLCYLSELRQDEQITLQWELTQQGVLLADGHRKTTDVSQGKERVFTAKAVYE